MYKELHKDFQNISKEIKALTVELVIACIAVSTLIIFQTISVIKQYKEFNKELDMKYQQIEQSFNEINNKFYK